MRYDPDRHRSFPTLEAAAEWFQKQRAAGRAEYEARTGLDDALNIILGPPIIGSKEGERLRAFVEGEDMLYPLSLIVFIVLLIANGYYALQGSAASAFVAGLLVGFLIWEVVATYALIKEIREEKRRAIL